MEYWTRTCRRCGRLFETKIPSQVVCIICLTIEACRLYQERICHGACEELGCLAAERDGDAT